MISSAHLHVAVDIGSRSHYVAIGHSEGQIVDEFTMPHTQEGFSLFFHRLAQQERLHALPVRVAMEGYNGWARPLDTQVLRRGYRLYNVNNLKLARFKEIFPGPAKTDPIDTHKMLELFALQQHLPLAKGVLQEIAPVPEANRIIKRLSRRRRQLVNEKIVLINRLQSDLQAVCPGILEITVSVDNLWFLRFLTCRDELPKLLRMHRKTLLSLPGVGQHYAQVIQDWQRKARFSDEVSYVGPMILADARRILSLLQAIATLEAELNKHAEHSVYAQRIGSIPGFDGKYDVIPAK